MDKGDLRVSRRQQNLLADAGVEAPQPKVTTDAERQLFIAEYRQRLARRANAVPRLVAAVSPTPIAPIAQADAKVRQATAPSRDVRQLSGAVVPAIADTTLTEARVITHTLDADRAAVIARYRRKLVEQRTPAATPASGRKVRFAEPSGAEGSANASWRAAAKPSKPAMKPATGPVSAPPAPGQVPEKYRGVAAFIAPGLLEATLYHFASLQERRFPQARVSEAKSGRYNAAPLWAQRAFQGYTFALRDPKASPRDVAWVASCNGRPIHEVEGDGQCGYYATIGAILSDTAAHLDHRAEVARRIDAVLADAAHFAESAPELREIQKAGGRILKAWVLEGKDPARTDRIAAHFVTLFARSVARQQADLTTQRAAFERLDAGQQQALREAVRVGHGLDFMTLWEASADADIAALRVLNAAFGGDIHSYFQEIPGKDEGGFLHFAEAWTMARSLNADTDHATFADAGALQNIASGLGYNFGAVANEVQDDGSAQTSVPMYPSKSGADAHRPLITLLNLNGIHWNYFT